MIYNIIITILLVMGLIYTVYEYIQVGSNTRELVRDENSKMTRLYGRKMYFFAAIIIMISLIGKIEKVFNLFWSSK